MKYENKYCAVSSYNTGELHETLHNYGESGYRLVSTEMAKNKYGIEVMYLFFAKEVEE